MDKGDRWELRNIFMPSEHQIHRMRARTLVLGIGSPIVTDDAIGFQFTGTTRNSHDADAADKYQTEEIASIVYTFLGDDNFGAVEW